VSASIPYTPEELTQRGLQSERLPRHVAIIMDGNGRWAQQRGLPRIEGHRRGVESVRRCVEECGRLSLDQLTLYCFSSENWKRPPLELDLLMNLLRWYVAAERNEIMRQDIRFTTIGRRDRLSPAIRSEVDQTIEMSRDNQGLTLCLALDYGARMEMVEAVRDIASKAARGELSPSEIEEATISDHLYTAGMPDPDLVIRTAGEMRISNFLLWQISYSELWVTSDPWPDFREAQLYAALREYGQRQRRFGGLNESK